MRVTKAFQRFNPWPIVVYNSNIQRDERGRKPKVHLVLAAIAFGACLVTRFRIGELTAFLSATVLLVGVMASAFTFLVNLRVKISEVAELADRPNLRTVVSSAAVGTLYVALSAMVLGLAIAATFAIPILNSQRGAGVISSAVIVGLLVHLLMSFLSVIRRLFGIYVAMFSADYAARPGTTQHR